MPPSLAVNATSAIPIPLWFAALAASAIAAGLLTFHLVTGRRMHPLWLVPLLATSLGLCLLGLESLEGLSADGDTATVWPKLLIVLLVAAGLKLQWSLPRWSLADDAFRVQRPLLLAVISVQLLVVAGTWRHLTAAATPFDVPLQEEQFQLVHAPDAVGLTDRGREIVLHRLDLFGEPNLAENSVLLDFQGRLIEQAPPDSDANCHGWVFTGGRYLLKGPSIDVILEDNGYQAVDAPSPGDLIVYRDVAGDIRHTGLVRSVCQDGLVLIESKWGIGARYLHRPEDQCYTQDFAYYRTQRASNSLRIVLRGQEESGGSADETQPAGQRLSQHGSSRDSQPGDSL